MIINAGIKRDGGRIGQSHELLLRWREEVDGEWVRRERRVTDYRPYCFVNPQDFRAKKERVDGRMVECNPPRKIAPFSVENRISDALDWRGGQPAEFHHHDSNGEPYKDAQGNELIRVVLDNPSYLWGLRSMFTPTYEADVPYEQLVEMDNINPIMPTVDVAVVIGANDVVNPSAVNDESSPIYGMPIIEAHNAKTVFILKRGQGKGFSGLVNKLFVMNNSRMVYGDAKATISAMVNELKG